MEVPKTFLSSQLQHLEDFWIGICETAFLSPCRVSMIHWFSEGSIMSMCIVVLDCGHGRYVVLEYCVGGLQEMLDKVPQHKFPVWQAHRSGGHGQNSTSQVLCLKIG